MSRLHLDFETASLANLPVVGAYAYARHPSTRVLCLAWAFDDEPVQVWRPGQHFPTAVLLHVLHAGEVHGWNVTFEWLIWNYVLIGAISLEDSRWFPGMLPEQLRDTMAASAYWGLPLGLDHASQAINASRKKDAEGHRLMLMMCRPRRYDPNGQPHWWHDEDPEKYDRLCAYCGRDVDAEREVGQSVPPLPDPEQRYWAMDLYMNSQGVPIDPELVRQLQTLAEVATELSNERMDQLTGGSVRTVTNTRALTEWLHKFGYPYPDIRKDTVAERLSQGQCTGLERMALELRAGGAKTSVAKLGRMLAAGGADIYPNDVVLYVRGMLQYYGANRTGRWAGRLIQLQNLPRGTVKDVLAAIKAISRPGMTPEILEIFFGGALDIVSSALRSCITAAPGMSLFVADFSQIEARVVCWIAGQLDMLRVFADPSQDPYTYAAAQQGSTDRQFGKVLTLALGFGMGVLKFQDTARKYGITLTLAEAQHAVDLWRAMNGQIVAFWRMMEAIVRQALIEPTITHTTGQLKVRMWRGHLLIGLPSGRHLVYRECKIATHTRTGKIGISYMGVDQYTKRWTRIWTWGGKITENIVQAIARDLMAEACWRAIYESALPMCLTAHDELIGHGVAWRADEYLAKLLEHMRTLPAWATDLPMQAVGWVGDRYRK